MPLAPGTRLGSYEIAAAIGAGGMGEVYRATDTKLKRRVALKVLPPAVASDRDRLARFQREAEVLASLNHPNIAAIYGLEDSDGPLAIVMELVEGPTLDEMIAGRGAGLQTGRTTGQSEGPALPLADALAIARQIAEALEAAHEQGIVHRDLKPANVKVRPDGTVKVLDFGLAKALAPGPEGHGLRGDLANSPTLTARATEIGMILGTAAYMAPEQARGRPVDHRADTWAFGVVLYEMLTGRRVFEGDDVSITLASVLKDDVRWDALPADLPVSIRRLLRRCLEKDPRRRLGWIGEARLALEDPGATELALGPSAASRPLWRRALPWAVAGVCAFGCAAALLAWAPWRTVPVPVPRRLLASIGADASMPTGTLGVGASAILSPDATTLAFVAQPAGTTESALYVRRLDQLEAEALSGTEGAGNPFFSPDGQWIGFFAAGQLKKVQVRGGAPVTLCPAPDNRGGTWTEDREIIFVPTPTSALARVSESGGTPKPFGPANEAQRNIRWPQALPGRRGILYTEHRLVQNSDYNRADVVVAPLTGGAPKVVVTGGFFARYVPRSLRSREGLDPTRGHLVYASEGRLLAMPFDLNRLESIGPPVPALDGSVLSVTAGTVQAALSTDGTLVYAPGQTDMLPSSIDWLTPDGKSAPLRAAKLQWTNPKFSPDGQTLAMDVFDGKQYDVWLHSLQHGTTRQLTFDPADDRSPVWTRDGRRIVFASDRAKRGVRNLYWVNADGSGEVGRLTDSPDSQVPSAWHPSEEILSFTAIRGSLDVMILPVEIDARGLTPGAPRAFIDSPAQEGAPVFSRDGRWIAYVALERDGADWNVWVQPFPASASGAKWKVSERGGTYPRWSPITNELLFVNPWDEVLPRVMAAAYEVVDGAFRSAPARPWSPAGIRRIGSSNNGYDLHPDGKRVAVAVIGDDGNLARDHVVFVFGFADYLQQIAPIRE